MSHVYHGELQGYPDAVLYDGCPTCESRTDVEGMLYLDPERVAVLWNLMLAKHKGVDEIPTVPFRHYTNAEHAAADTLYGLAVFLERFTTINPWRPLTDLRVVPGLFARS